MILNRNEKIIIELLTITLSLYDLYIISNNGIYIGICDVDRFPSKHIVGWVSDSSE